MSKCNKCSRGLKNCKCHKTVVNKPVEVKVGGAGNDGLNNYELWLLEGHTGTLEEYLESLKGKDGNHYERRYAKNTSSTIPPTIVSTDRIPSGWSTQIPNREEGEYVWVAEAQVSTSTPSELITDWQVTLMTGESSDLAPVRGEDIFNQ